MSGERGRRSAAIRAAVAALAATGQPITVIGERVGVSRQRVQRVIAEDPALSLEWRQARARARAAREQERAQERERVRPRAVHDERWSRDLERLHRYMRAHGHQPSAARERWEGRDLGRWLAHTRGRHAGGALAAWRLDALIAAGVDMSPHSGDRRSCLLPHDIPDPTPARRAREAHARVVLATDTAAEVARALGIALDRVALLRAGLGIDEPAPPQVQPREGDRLQCLECGRWLRAMTWHLRSTHEMTAREYKIAHGLRIGEPLRAHDLTEASRRVGQERAARDPSLGDPLRALPRQQRADTARRSRADLAGLLSTSPGYADYRQKLAASTSRSSRARTEAAHAAAATAAGYASWAEFVRSTVAVSAAAAGRMVGRSETQILAARRQVIGPGWRALKPDWRRSPDPDPQ